MTIKSVTGPVSFLRVHAVGSKYGPPQDQLDAEVIIKIQNQPGAYGFQLRADNNLPVAEAMLGLISGAFEDRKPVTLEYDEQPGRSNQLVFRVIRQA